MCNCTGDYHDEAYCDTTIRGFCETWETDGKSTRVYLQYLLPNEGILLYNKYGWSATHENNETLLELKIKRRISRI